MTDVYTSYYAYAKNLPQTICPISIAGKNPDISSFPIEMKCLAPKYDFFKKYKETGDKDYYIRHFKEEVLDKLDAQTVYSNLQRLSEGKIPCLMCYEKPGDFCHRHLVADWLEDKLHIVVKEYEPLETNTLY